MTQMHNIWIGAELTEEDGSHRNSTFPIAESDETLIAMLDARRKAFEEKWAGGETFNNIG